MQIITLRARKRSEVRAKKAKDHIPFGNAFMEGERLSHSMYDKGGDLFLCAGETFTPQLRKELVEKRSDQLIFGLDEEELVAVETYKHKKFQGLLGDTRKLHGETLRAVAKERIERGVYRRGKSQVYVDRLTRPLSREEVKRISEFDSGCDYVISANMNGAVNQISEYRRSADDGFVVRAVIKQFEKLDAAKTKEIGALLAAATDRDLEPLLIFLGLATKPAPRQAGRKATAGATPPAPPKSESTSRSPVGKALDEIAKARLAMAGARDDEPVAQVDFNPHTGRTLKEKEEASAHFAQVVDVIRNAMRPVKGKNRTTFGAGPVNKIRGIAQAGIDRVVRDHDLFLNFLNRPDEGDYVVNHAFKSSILAIELGTVLGLTKGETTDLGISSMLQDIGMVMLDEEVLNKRNPLTVSELEEIQRHPISSSKLCADSESVSKNATQIILHSHERTDGNGYPNGLTGEAINHLAKVLSVANLYVALITPRPFRPAQSRGHAIQTLLSYSHRGLLPSDVVQKLIETLSAYPVGSLVQLDDGRTAKVIKSNGEKFTRPEVAVILNSDGEPIRDDVINLATSNHKILRGLDDAECPDVDYMAGF